MSRPAAALLAAAVVVLVPATAAQAAMPPQYRNCTALNAPQHHPHGIGEAKAVDRVGATSKPVTTFTRDTAGYRRAMSHNRGLDRDGDKIACEKR